MITYYITMETPIEGRNFWIEEKEEQISYANFYYPGESPWDKEEREKQYCETPLLLKAKRQMEEYFAGKRKEFDLPLLLEGTAFQVEDWKALCTIPYGETRSYGQLAAQIGRPKASRAVGMANHNNPISVIVPCHRVIGANGKLVGYGGGLDVKEALLALERKTRYAPIEVLSYSVKLAGMDSNNKGGYYDGMERSFRNEKEHSEI